MLSHKSSLETDQIIDAFEWMGLFSDHPVSPRGTPLDTLCTRLEEILKYQPGERDMVIFEHQFVIEHQDGALVRPTLSILHRQQLR